MNRPHGYLSSLIIIALLLLPACSTSPTDTTVSTNTQATGQIDPDATGGVLLGTVATGLSSAQVEVWAQNLTIESDAIVSFDAVIVNQCRCPIEAPIYFVITDLIPDVMQVENADMDGPDGPVFDFSDDVGDDGILGPLEQSDPVKMQFRWPEPMSFAIGFRVDAGPPSGGSISGVVFNDFDGDGVRDASEPGVAGVVVELRPSASEALSRVITDRAGHYAFGDLRADVYRVTALPLPNVPIRLTTSNPLVVTLIELADGSVSHFDGADFGYVVGIPPQPGMPVFGPVDVGPGSSNGTVFETTFIVPNFFAPVNFYLIVTPPPIVGPLPLRIDKASVEIDGVPVWDFECMPTDSITCEPHPVRIPVDLYPQRNDTMERKIRITTEGDAHSFLMYSIVAENIIR